MAVALWTILLGHVATSHGAVARNGHIKGEDHAHFYVLGRLALEGRTVLLYDTAGQADYLEDVIPGAPRTVFVPVYGPQVALMFAPLAALPYLWSFAAWSLLSIGLFVACCWRVWTWFDSLRPYRVDLLVLAIACPALWQLVLFGQNSAVGLTAMIAGWWCLREKRPVLAGLALGILFYKPQLALATVAVMLATAQWRVVAGMAVAGAGQMLAAAVLLGSGTLLEYLAMLRRLGTIVELIEPKPFLMYSLRIFFEMLPLPPVIGLALATACSVALLVMVVRCWKLERDVDKSFALLLIVSVLISPHTTVYDLVLTAPALIVIAARLLESVSGKRMARTASWLLAAAYLLPLASWLAAVVPIQPLVVCLVALTFVTLRLEVPPRPSHRIPQAVPA